MTVRMPEIGQQGDGGKETPPEAEAQAAPTSWGKERALGSKGTRALGLLEASCGNLVALVLTQTEPHPQQGHHSARGYAYIHREPTGNWP